jgi:hypothetical protein
MFTKHASLTPLDFTLQAMFAITSDAAEFRVATAIILAKSANLGINFIRAVKWCYFNTLVPSLACSASKNCGTRHMRCTTSEASRQCHELLL